MKFLEFLIFIVISIIFVFVYISIFKGPIIRSNNEGDNNYISKLVTITIIFNEIPEITNKLEYTLQDIFYANKNMTNDDIARYLLDHQDLFDNEMNSIKYRIEATYNELPSLHKIIVKAEDI